LRTERQSECRGLKCILRDCRGPLRPQHGRAPAVREDGGYLLEADARPGERRAGDRREGLRHRGARRRRGEAVTGSTFTTPSPPPPPPPPPRPAHLPPSRSGRGLSTAPRPPAPRAGPSRIVARGRPPTEARAELLSERLRLPPQGDELRRGGRGQWGGPLAVL